MLQPYILYLIPIHGRIDLDFSLHRIFIIAIRNFNIVKECISSLSGTPH